MTGLICTALGLVARREELRDTCTTAIQVPISKRRAILLRPRMEFLSRCYCGGLGSASSAKSVRALPWAETNAVLSRELPVPKTPMSLLVAVLFLGEVGDPTARSPIQGETRSMPSRAPVVVWQPSHQTDTGVDFSEAAVSNGIVEAAMVTSPSLQEYKVWSLGVPNVHHADRGSNTVIEHTSLAVNGHLSGYAYELQQANRLAPDVFIAVHNNGGTNRHAVWGYIHAGDKFESANHLLAVRLVRAITTATNLENGGVLLDSSTGRNNYRCSSTGKLGFYSLDENVNHAPYRLLLEIGDNERSREYLKDPANQRILGAAIKKELAAWLAETWKE